MFWDKIKKLILLDEEEFDDALYTDEEFNGEEIKEEHEQEQDNSFMGRIRRFAIPDEYTEEIEEPHINFRERIKKFFAYEEKLIPVEKRRISRIFDLPLLTLVIIIVAIGLIVIAGLRGDNAAFEPFYFFKKQLVAAIMGVFLMLIISRIDYHAILRFAWLSYIVSIFLGVMVLVMPSTVEYGARRWLSFGGFSIQPATLIVLSTILVLTILFSQQKELTFGRIMISGVVTMISVMLIMLQHYLAYVIVLMLLFFLYVYIKKPKIALAFFGLGVAMLAVFLSMSPYSSSRLSVFLDPFNDPTSMGYQVIQSMYAIKEGGIFGKGLGAYELSYALPDAHHGYILSAVSYQLGLVGAIILLLLLSLLCIRIAIIAAKSKDMLGFMLGAGICGKFVISTVFNTLNTVNMIPPTAFTGLPFVSYSGTALMLDLVAVGIILNISRQTQNVNALSKKGGEA